tara:strand:+ start:3884 stop:4459 length:576 start_codon:yes stop_codon:yes gene_type:complete
MYFDEILLFLANNTFDYKFIIFFYIISIILLSLPIPYTFIIIANVYVFGWYGFFIVILSIPLGAILTYYYVIKLNGFIKKLSFIENKTINKNFFKNIYFLIIARATLPFFLVSLAMSIFKISVKKYLLITILGTFTNVLLVSIIVEEIRDTIIKYDDIIINWKDPKFIIPLFIIVMLIFITNYFKKRFKLR